MSLFALGAGCSTTTTVIQYGDGGTGAASIPIGDTALFDSPSCGTGVCLVDARTGLDEYCSADCDKVRCPTGYLCQATSFDTSRHACFRDPNAPASLLDARLSCLAKNKSTWRAMAK